MNECGKQPLRSDDSRRARMMGSTLFRHFSSHARTHFSMSVCQCHCRSVNITLPSSLSHSPLLGAFFLLQVVVELIKVFRRLPRIFSHQTFSAFCPEFCCVQALPAPPVARTERTPLLFHSFIFVVASPSSLAPLAADPTV